MSKVKDENKLQIQLKIDRLKDREIFDILNVADNKSDFIKDAIFYFMHHIEQGKIINRNYPYNKVNIQLDISPEDSNMDNFLTEDEVCIHPKQQESTSHDKLLIGDMSEEEIDDYEDDNFDDVDIM